MTYRPLQGVRVLEVAQFTFTPSAGAILADWGAEVIKVENADTGDAQRGLSVGNAAAGAGSFQPLMEHANRGKRSIGLALNTPEGRDVLYQLAANADVFLTNYLPRVRRSLQIEVEHLRAANPQIIYARGSALGDQGPERELGGFDSSCFWARGGISAAATPPDAPRMIAQPGAAFGDSLGGMAMAGGIAAALLGRATTGEPSELDVSLLATGAWAMGLPIDIALLTGEPPQAQPFNQPTTGFNPLVGLYQTSDQRWISIVCLQVTRYWPEFVTLAGHPEAATDPRWATFEAMNDPDNLAAATDLVRSIIGARPFAEWIEVLRNFSGQWAPLQNAVEVGNDPQLRANGYIRPVVDADGVERELVANPVQFDATPPDLTRGPLFAEHTDEILAELGLDEDQIIELKIAGAVT